MTDAKKNRLVNWIIGVAISLAAVYFLGNVITFYMPGTSEVSSAPPSGGGGQ